MLMWNTIYKDEFYMDATNFGHFYRFAVNPFAE